MIVTGITDHHAMITAGSAIAKATRFCIPQLVPVGHIAEPIRNSTNKPVL
jgi:hypothetical protein